MAGTGNQRTITADVDWTFPLNFVEVVWGDGKKVDRQVISATDSAPFGTQAFRDSVRCHRQGMGAFCGLGLGRQRRLRSAGLGVGKGRADDEPRQVVDAGRNRRREKGES